MGGGGGHDSTPGDNPVEQGDVGVEPLSFKTPGVKSGYHFNPAGDAEGGPDPDDRWTDTSLPSEVAPIDQAAPPEHGTALPLDDSTPSDNPVEPGTESSRDSSED